MHESIENISAFFATKPVPSGYCLKPTSTVQLVAPRKGDSDPQPLRLCSCPLWIAARARDAKSTAWRFRLEWLCPDGELRSLLVPATDLNSRQSTLIDELADQGVLVHPAAQMNFRTYLYESQSLPNLPRQRLVQRLGFYPLPDRRLPAFVLPDRVIMPPLAEGENVLAEELVYQSPLRVQSIEGYRSSGTLAEWQDCVAPFGDHAVIVTGILMGLAGPFATMAGQENGGLHLYGETSTGKSTTLQAGASVAGYAADAARAAESGSLFQRWNTTGNAVEGMLAPHSGMTVVIDEVGANDGGMNLYNAFGGLTKARLSEGGAMRGQATWNVQILSSGECSMRHHIETAGHQPATAGLGARMLDVPTQDVLDCASQLGAPALPSPEVLGPMITQLKDDCGHYYGTALPALIENVLAYFADDGGLETQLRAQVDDECQGLCDEASQPNGKLSGPQRRALSRLALLAVIGKWAADTVLPFTEEQVMRAVRAVRDAWLSTDTYVTEGERVLRAVKDYAIRHANGAISWERGVSANEMPYFWLRSDGLMAFTDEQLKRASGSANLAAVGKILTRENWLYRNDSTRQRSDTPAVLKGEGNPNRMYLLLSSPILGELTSVLSSSAAQSVDRPADHHTRELAPQPTRRIQ